MTHQRIRIRFRKEGDLRWTGHRDLARALERLFRRAELRLRMSEGFHPHPKINFPSALAVGIEGVSELVEVDLTEAVDTDTLHQQLRRLAPPGLVVDEIRSVRPDGPKPNVESFVYEIEVPESKWHETKKLISQLLAIASYFIERPGRKQPIDLRSGVQDLTLDQGVLRMKLRALETANIRPREVLEVLRLQELEHAGYLLTRTTLQLTQEGKKNVKTQNTHQRSGAN